VTSNRSEASVGYATMDGDSAGSLAPIGGIDKHYLRSWLCWLEKNAPHGAKPIAALQYINAQQPTAELRPVSAHQTDEADLMPYEILNQIEHAFLVRHLAPCAIYAELAAQKPELQKKQLGEWVARFFTLWSRNQWKRERFAPAFHLDDHSVDPRSWCRFPILSAGFTEELQELHAKIAKEP